MSKIRLHGSSSGYTEIAPVAASSNNTITLPDSGTILSHDGNGAVGVTSITVGTGVTIGDGRVTCTTLHGSGANLTSIPAANLVGVCTSGLTKTGGFGKILQIVQHSFTTGQFTTTSNSYVDVTGFTQAITPTAASSKILVMLSCQVQTNPSGTYNGQCDMSINRSINGGSYTAIAAQNQGNYIQETYASYHDNSLNINLLDSPSYSLGNAITYKMQVKSADTSVTTRVNVTCGGITNGASKLILVEVAA